jgi:hypothetical protein
LHFAHLCRQDGAQTDTTSAGMADAVERKVLV